MNKDEILARLKTMANPDNVAGMRRYGINPAGTLGVPIPELRSMAKEIGKNHGLALELWETDVHEARLLACFIDDPKQVTEEQMERWATDFDSWDVVDQACGNLFDRTRYAYRKATEWSTRSETFVKRASFSLMAYLAVHDKKAPDDKFEVFLPIIARESEDTRNYVKKAVNWALRQIGKRNRHLNELAIETARQIGEMKSSTARWVAADALRELTSEKIQQRFK